MENYFFDFDGTICESRDIYVVAVQKAFEARGVRVPTQSEVYNAMGIPIDVSIAKWAKKGHREDLSKQLFKESMAEYNAIEDDMVKIFPGIVKTLNELKLAGKTLFVVSSKTHAEVEHNLNNLHLASLFTDFVGSDEVENHKPAPDEINKLVKKYDLDVNDSIMLGDAKYDMRMGKNAKTKTCACTWGAFDIESLEKEQPTYTANYPTEILDL